jgi:hypothetical protein
MQGYDLDRALLSYFKDQFPIYRQTRKFLSPVISVEVESLI